GGRAGGVSVWCSGGGPGGGPHADVGGGGNPPLPAGSRRAPPPPIFHPRLGFCGLRAKRGRPRLCRNCNHPAPACPIGELLRELPDQGFALTSIPRNFENAIFETDKRHVAFERAPD